MDFSDILTSSRYLIDSRVHCVYYFLFKLFFFLTENFKVKRVRPSSIGDRGKYIKYISFPSLPAVVKVKVKQPLLQAYVAQRVPVG